MEHRTITSRDRRGGGLSNADRLRTLSEEWRDGKKDRDVAYESRLKGLVINLKVTDKRLLIRAKTPGAFQVQYYLLQNFGIFNVLVITSLL